MKLLIMVMLPLIGGQDSEATSHEKLTEIVEAIKAQERNLTNIAFERITTTKLSEDPRAQPGRGKLPMRSRERIFYQRHGDKYSYSCFGEQVFAGKVNIYRQETKYDGEVSRTLTSGPKTLHPEITGTAEFRDGFVPLNREIGFNGYFTEDWNLGSGLSDILTYGRPFQKTEFSSTFEGTERIDHLDCYRIANDQWTSRDDRIPWQSQVRSHCVIWICPSRSYLPIRIEVYRPNLSEKHTKEPTRIGEVTEFVEVKEGVWFPKRVRWRKYDIREDKESIVVREYHCEYDAIDLDPPSDDELFSELILPVGTELEVLDKGANSVLKGIIGKTLPADYRYRKPH